MSDHNKSDPKVELEALAEKYATDIGESESDRDGALTILSKGMVDLSSGLVGAISNLVGTDGEEMAKGKKMAKGDEPKEASGAKDNLDDYDDEMEEDDKKPSGDQGAGYEDMRMGDDYDEDYFDATDFLVDLKKSINNGFSVLDRRLSRLEKAVDAKADAAALDDFRDALGGVQVQMAKAVLGTHEILMQQPVIPATAVDQSLNASLRVVRRTMKDVFNGDNDITPAKMLKAMSQHIITEGDYTYWKQHKNFPCDEATNKELTEKITAL